MKTWHIDQKSNHPAWGTITIRSDNGAIADMAPWPNGEERLANARLIAAAPELLNALELAEATIKRLERHAPGSANGTLDVIKAALAKVEA